MKFDMGFLFKFDFFKFLKNLFLNVILFIFVMGILTLISIPISSHYGEMGQSIYSHITAVFLILFLFYKLLGWIKANNN